MQALKEDELNLDKMIRNTLYTYSLFVPKLYILHAMLKENVLNLELHEPDGVDGEDEVEDEEAEEGDVDEGLPAICIRERAWGKVSVFSK